MKDFKYYNQITMYKKNEQKKLYEEIKQLVVNYETLCEVSYKVIAKETNRDKVAKILTELLPNAKIHNYTLENCIDVSFLKGAIYTIAFNGEIEVLTNIEYLDFYGNIWNMDLEEYKELLLELKMFIEV